MKSKRAVYRQFLSMLHNMEKKELIDDMWYSPYDECYCLVGAMLNSREIDLSDLGDVDDAAKKLDIDYNLLIKLTELNDHDPSYFAAQQSARRETPSERFIRVRAALRQWVKDELAVGQRGDS